MQRSFSTDDNEVFWNNNRASYQGGKNARHLSDLVKDLIGDKVLDAGAGDGSLVRALRSQFPRKAIVGLDIAPKSEDVIEGNLTDTGYPDASFDTVFCAEVIEHLPHETLQAILSELERILRPGGYLIGTTPYAEDLAESEVTCPNCHTRFHRWGHQHSFDEDDIQSIVGKSGLHITWLARVKYKKVRNLRPLGPRMTRAIIANRWLIRPNGRTKLVFIATKQ